MLTNALTNQMVIADDLKQQAEKIDRYFTDLLVNATEVPDVQKHRDMGFSSVGRDSFVDELKLTIEQAREYQKLQIRFPGYLIVMTKHLLAWTMIHGLYRGEHFQFTGLIPDTNADHITRFNNLLTWEDTKVEFKDADNKWKPVPATLLKNKAFRKKLDDGKSSGIHTANGCRIAFPANTITSGRSYLSSANVRALPSYKMIADFKFFDRTAFLTDSAKAATYYTPNPDPLVLLEKGEFQVIVTAWGHEETLLPSLKNVSQNPI